MLAHESANVRVLEVHLIEDQVRAVPDGEQNVVVGAIALIRSRALVNGLVPGNIRLTVNT